MYVPRHFRQDDPILLSTAMQRFAAATLVSQGADGLLASHVPIEVIAAPAPWGLLRCHLARANPHAESLAQGGPVLAIFNGPEGYVSPNWYPSKADHGKVVPTWNYAAVHARGTAVTFTDPDRLRAHVSALTDRFETDHAAPGAIDAAPHDFIAGMLQAIIGVEITLTEVTGKWKMSQNRAPADRAGVIAGLRDTGAAALADEMERAHDISHPKGE
ncbi:MAG: FMN-binding negative transcriptional regulator [Pseudomonadota bacterium]|nr:FMN-binding negative transcriptional regulator [Pseudomonadota bacterium]